jgi:hypothetical protein
MGRIVRTVDLSSKSNGDILVHSKVCDFVHVTNEAIYVL